VPQISNLDHVVLQLRRQLADRAKREGTRSPTSSPAKTSSEPMPLMGTVGGQASAVKEAGGESRAVGRAALEEILRAEFGSALTNDAGFLDVVDRVAEAFHADPAIRAEFESLLKALSKR
jgi:hypothetical protein